MINLIYTPTVNFAMQQNHVPVIRQLVLTNTGNNNLENISVEISSEPEFCSVWTQIVEFLPPNVPFDLGAVSIHISGKFLAELTERISALFTVKIKRNEEVINSNTFPIDILAFDQWNGIKTLPETLAAFVTPNHPGIAKIAQRASTILEEWTGNPSLDEYQSKNPDRVKKQMAAVFEAIAERKIIYSSTPASFEENGQRIRLCDSIFSQNMANCLDMSLLYASCLESIGIRPLIVIVKGHAFAGAWLEENSYADSVNDDASLLSKRTADGINEILLVEATSMNSGQETSFDEAVMLANNHLEEKNFILSLDVKRARYGGIRPLPLRIQTAEGWEIVEDKVNYTRNNDAPSEIHTTKDEIVLQLSQELTKQSLWERKLLDLSLRNNLLNIRITKSTIQLITGRLGEFEDKLAEGEEFQIISKPADWNNELRDTGIYKSLNQTDPIIELVNNELSQKKLRTYLTETELNQSLTTLYRSAKLSLEENGANTLYLALGLLKWYETNASERPRYAPILLLPIDIVRKSAQKGFTIRSREEETVMNITLLEMLRQNFGIVIDGLDPLPKDESGVDVKGIFNIIRKEIMSQSRWDVEEQAFLSTFSFNKFIMWNDIRNNTSKLCENKIVSSLISGKMEWEAEEELLKTNNLDKDFYPSDVALPISADSSQLEAICAANLDKSFVLHGPPGTGKSQTITNIIANMLYNGKKVLFVAEKMAALSVVQNRLNAIGLGNFCLELHSNKSKKTAVIEQLKDATQTVKTIEPEEFALQAERLHKLRTELNEYVEALHHKYEFGLSLYDCFSNYAQYVSIPDKIFFNAEVIEKQDKIQLITLEDSAEELKAAAQLCGCAYRHPLETIGLLTYSQQIKNDAQQTLNQYSDVLQKQNQLVKKISQALKIETPVVSFSQAQALKEITTILINVPDAPATLLNIDNISNLEELISLSEHGLEREKAKDKLLKQFTKDILNTEAEKMLFDWQQASAKWFLPKLMGQNAILKSLKKYAKATISKNEVVDILENCIHYQQEQQLIDNEANFLQSTLDSLWKNSNCNWQRITELSNAVINLNQQLAHVFTNSSQLKDAKRNLVNEYTSNTDVYLNTYKLFFQQYTDSFEETRNLENTLSLLLNIDFSALKNQHSDWITDSEKIVKGWIDNIDLLRDWCNWLIIKQKVEVTELKPLVSLFEKGEIEAGQIVDIFKKGLYRSCAEYIIGKEAVLSSFNGKLFEDKIRKFKEINQRFEELTKEELFAKLASKIPSFTQEASQNSEIGILQRAIRNNARALSIRKLFDSIPTLLTRLCPCMLMSPISVAQYIDAGNLKFDLVIFDEASQMPTCEAVGAIARGKNMVVVGDPKQMPPTNFFSVNQVDEDNIEKEDLESILDDCLALSLPQKHLLWHYRSKHESLIAFSNSQYYENKLLTFPSPDDISTKVTYVHVEGFYDKGKSRQNKYEAQAVVDDILKRLSSPELSKKSIGVVTFSAVQQSLIEDMLNDAFSIRTDLEAIAMNSEEPLFVKNLENVQGDERDVILFSVGYGPDKNGNLSLNFGPLNRDGGWRRLNVAVSRARYEMTVYSTLKADQIDLTRTSSEGVAGLKAFLEYAQKGKRAILTKNIQRDLTKNELETLIASGVSKHGYEVHTNIGCSGYKIDIAVVHPEKKSEYIIGILCDGYNYNAAKTARDREIVQRDVLKLLGWNIHRLWSPDWWVNSDKVINDILVAIENAIKSEKNIPEKKAQEEPIKGITYPKKEVIPPKTDVGTTKAVVRNNQNITAIPYQFAYLPLVEISPEDFNNSEHEQFIREQIKEIIEIEAPISKDLLCDRIFTTWGILRVGVRVENHLQNILSSMNYPSTTFEDKTFLWDEGQNPSEYSIYRTVDNEEKRRAVDEIPPEEIVNATREVLINQISLPISELARETAKLFGFMRLTSVVEVAMKNGIKKAVEKGFGIYENGKVKVSE